MFFHFIKTINLISGLFLILLTARLAAYYSRFQLCLHFDIVLSFLDSIWYSFGSLSCLKYLSFQTVILVLGSYYIFRQTQKQFLLQLVGVFRGGSRAAATSNMERFVIIVNGFQPLTIITKHFILDVAAALDPPLVFIEKQLKIW